MRVHALLGLRVEHVVERLHPLGDALRQQRAGGIDDVDAVRAVGLHQLRLARQLGRRRHVRHHQEADDVHAELARVLDVLPGDVGFGRMRRDAHRLRAGAVRGVEILDRADAGEQQDGDVRALHAVDRRPRSTRESVCALNP